jgi:hypothetical protein
MMYGTKPAKLKPLAVGPNARWTKGELLAAIDRCEKDVAQMVARHARPEEIERRREGIDMLWKWMEVAEE